MLWQQGIDILKCQDGIDDSQIIRLHLASSRVTELKRYFKATFSHVNGMQDNDSEKSAISPYRDALILILVELRVRGFEVDYQGLIYKSCYFFPIPNRFKTEKNRQIHAIKSMDVEQMIFYAQQTLNYVAGKAYKSSKIG